MAGEKFVYEKLGELGIDDSEATGKPLIDPAELDEKQPAAKPRVRVKAPGVKVHVHRED